MVAAIIQVLFACRHKRMTRPITPARRPGAQRGNSYVSCLDCGKQFEYDTESLRIGPPIMETAAAVR